MNCSNCGQTLEVGAAFCGNCGQPILQPTVTTEEQGLPIASSTAADPSIQASVDNTLPESEAASSPTSNEPSDAHQSVQKNSPIAQIYANQASEARRSPPTSHPRNFAIATPSGVPSYAVPIADHQSGEMKASMSLVVGILGIVGSIFIPLVGISLGVAGIVLGTMSRRVIKRGMSTAGIIISCIALLAGLAAWAYVISQDPRFDHKVSNTATVSTSGPAVSAQSITTPCYSVDFGSTLNIQNNNGSCNMNAYNGATLDASTNAYKVYGTISTVSSRGFMNLAKQAIERDIAQSLPSFTITHESSGQFADSPAYFVTANDGQGISLVEAVALHATTNGDNFFVFVHAVNSGTADLNDLQMNWQWQ